MTSRKPNRRERRAAKPVDLDALYVNAMPELVASWDGTSDQVGYVYLPAPGEHVRVGWLDRSGSADRLLEMAHSMRDSDPQAKAKLQHIAVQVLQPHPNKDLYSVVIAYSGAALATVPRSHLDQQLQAGATEEAKQARRAIVEQMKDHAIQGLLEREEHGRDLDEAVVLILDPEDHAAKPLIDVITAVTGHVAGEQHASGKGPMLVVWERAKLLNGLRSIRPREAAWLEKPAPHDTARYICMAHGGVTVGYVQVHRKPNSP